MEDTRGNTTLTQGQRERIELNRQKALTLRRARVRAKPYEKRAPTEGRPSIQGLQEDTRGGFLLEGSEAEEASVWQELHSGPGVQDDGTTAVRVCGGRVWYMALTTVR